MVLSKILVSDPGPSWPSCFHHYERKENEFVYLHKNVERHFSKGLKFALIVIG